MRACATSSVHINGLPRFNVEKATTHRLAWVLTPDGLIIARVRESKSPSHQDLLILCRKIWDEGGESGSQLVIRCRMQTLDWLRNEDEIK